MAADSPEPFELLIALAEPGTDQTLSAALDAAGYVARHAAGGARALAEVQARCPDLVLLAGGWPREDRLDLCRKLHEAALPKGAYLVVVLDAAARADVAALLDAGVDDVLVEPVEPAELLARLRSATRRMQRERELRALARVDPLTGLLTRRSLLEELTGQWAAWRRRGAPLSCVVVDADHFKRINDTHGHAAGDRALKSVADALSGECRRDDVLARFGGEEFVALLPGADEEAAAAWAERVRSRVAALELRFDGRPARVTCSAGVAAARPEMRDAAELLEAADRALIAAKHAGRDRVETHSRLNE